MAISVILFALQLILGIIIFDFFDPKQKFTASERLLYGMAVGFLFSNFLILVFALIFKSLFSAIILYIIAFCIVLALKINGLIAFYKILKTSFKNIDWNLKNNFWIFPLLLIFVPYLYYLWKVLFIGKNGNLMAPYSGWGDNGFHISLIQRFATANPFNLDNPLLAGAKITYHFLFDFSSGILYYLNNNLLFSYRLPLISLGIIFFCSLFVFALRVLNSKILGIAAIAFIFLGSGLGFVLAANNAMHYFSLDGFSGLFSIITNPPYEYTKINSDANVSENLIAFKNINWMIPVVLFLSHQRAFLIGVLCFIIILSAINNYGKDKIFWRFGLIAGFLPLAHAHSFFAIFIIMAVLFWFYLRNYLTWIKFAIITALISLPQIIYLKMANNSNFLIKPYFGWMLCEHNKSWFFCDKTGFYDSNFFFFCIKNFGLIFLVWIFAVLLSFFVKFRRNQYFSGVNFDFKFVLASIILFLTPNLFLFQPWSFDNGKILFYWHFIAVVFCVLPFIRFFWNKNVVFRPIIIIFFFFSIISGILDFSGKISSIENISYGYGENEKENVEMAEWIKKNTDPNSLFLTNSWVNPVPVFLAGRKIYLGYPGWLWTEGLDYYKNQKRGREILNNNIEMACEEKIDYILLDNELRKNYNVSNDEYILQNTEILFTQNTPYETRMILKTICKD